jgi:hypothetical protein
VRDKNKDIIKHLDAERDFDFKDILYDVRHEREYKSSRTGAIFYKFCVKETAPKREARKNQQDSLCNSETKP